MAKPVWNMKQIIDQLDADVQWRQPIELAFKTWDDFIPTTLRHEHTNADISFNHTNSLNYTNRDAAGPVGNALPYPSEGISPGTVVPTDPLLAQQWHLIQTVAGRFDLNVRGAWDPAMGKAYTGAGVRVVVVDDGFDYNHADLAAPYNESLDFDYRDNDNDPFGVAFDADPDDEDSHGTACMGIIGADNNGTGVVGVAFDAELFGFRTANRIDDDWLQDIRDAIDDAATNPTPAHVLSVSQAISNDEDSWFELTQAFTRFDEIRTSIATAVDGGRNGNGMIIVKSAGNARTDGYDINADSWSKDTRQIVVAAVDQNGFFSSYSSYGAPILISAFGTPSPGEVLTTDRTGGGGVGYDNFAGNTDYALFSGTSAATPMVAGVVALMLEAQPLLGWRDVQDILAYSARHVGNGIGGAEAHPWRWNGARDWNGGGLHYSESYGYGLVDATAAVRLAENWLVQNMGNQRSSNQTAHVMDVFDGSTVIPNGDANGVLFSGNSGVSHHVDRVTVTVTFSTTFLSDLEVYLFSPNGVVSELIADNGGGGDYMDSWTFETQAFRGVRGNGPWTVKIGDDHGSDTLTVYDVVITLYGTDQVDDRYIYTDEYSVWRGIGGHSSTVQDLNGGFIDEINAAAVTTGSVINLTPGSASTIDGSPVTIAAGTIIENAHGGDGNDTINGNGVANIIHGNRGHDTLFGDADLDILYGEDGNDILIGGSGLSFGFGDNLLGGPGFDYASYENSPSPVVVSLNFSGPQSGGDAAGDLLFDIEGVIGSAFGDTLTGNAGPNILDGGANNDTLNGGGENDQYYVDSAGDVVNEAANEGTDRVFAGASYTLAAGQSIETLSTLSDVSTTAIDLTGNEIVNVLIGNDGVNRLDGRGAADVMAGYGGNDWYFVDNVGDRVVWEGARDGTDRVFAGVSYTLAATEKIETLSTLSDIGTGAINLTGNDIVNVLIGNDGVNRLDGRGAADVMAGYGGDDWYFVDVAGDKVVFEGASDGNDRVFAGVSYTLAAGQSIETLSTLSDVSTTAIDLTGNEIVNILIGNAGANRLDGRGGADVMAGYGGDDWYFVDVAGDKVVWEGATDGTDRVFAGASYTLAATQRIETLSTLSDISTTAINLTGNEFANTLIANSGANVLNGGTGADVLASYGGNDIFLFNTAIGPSNIDTLYDFVVANDTVHLENAIFTQLTTPAGNTLSAGQFFTGAAAHDADDRIIYNSATGALFYDPDGTGAAAAIQFAKAGTGLALTNADFFVV